MRTSRASAVWEGGLKGGKGTFKAQSGAFGGGYTFATRFESAKGTNPEELIAAAHAACFAMQFSADLEKAGATDTKVDVTAACTIEAGKIEKMELAVRGSVKGIDEATFRKTAEGAKENCPVSKALKGNVQLVLDARLE